MLVTQMQLEVKLYVLRKVQSQSRGAWSGMSYIKPAPEQGSPQDPI